MKSTKIDIMDKQMNADKTVFRKMLIWLLLIIAIGSIVLAGMAAIPAPCCNKSQNESSSPASDTQGAALLEQDRLASILVNKEARILLSMSACCLLAAIVVSFDLARHSRMERKI